MHPVLAVTNEVLMWVCVRKGAHKLAGDLRNFVMTVILNHVEVGDLVISRAIPNGGKEWVGLCLYKDDSIIKFTNDRNERRALFFHDGECYRETFFEYSTVIKPNKS